MRRTLVSGLMLAALAACGQGAAPEGAEVESEAAEAPAPTATSEGVALDAIDACVFTQAEVSAALGGSYGAGVPVAPIPGDRGAIALTTNSAAAWDNCVST